jgi:ribonuclease G
MSKGAYLIIEHTEALHVIDVNSGNRSNKASNQEDTAMEVNMIAAAKSLDNCVYVIWVVLS